MCNTDDPTDLRYASIEVRRSEKKMKEELKILKSKKHNLKLRLNLSKEGIYLN
jgi:hypothetical protein